MDDEQTDALLKAIKLDIADLLIDDPMLLASSVLRKVVVAPEGKKFLISDWSNIEGRLVAWFAGEAWKLKVFADFDKGIGHDVYNLAYADAFKIAIDLVGKSERNIGKVLELFLGYEGGVGAFIIGAAAYGFDIEALADKIYYTLPADHRKDSTEYLEWVKKKKRDTYGLSDMAFVTADTLKRAWRANHPETVRLWRDLRDNACYTIITGEPSQCGRLSFDKKGSWLRMKLPSGRYLNYPQAQAKNGAISYMGENQYTRKWCRLNTFGGKLLENAAQATGLDILLEGIERCENYK